MIDYRTACCGVYTAQGECTCCEYCPKCGKMWPDVEGEDMSFKSEISDEYKDFNGLVCNRKCLPTEVNPSGNGICYTGEYACILNRLGGMDGWQAGLWRGTVAGCWKKLGLLSRGHGQPDLESVDDYYGFFAACAVTGSDDFAKYVLRYGLKNYGSFNNVEPGRWSWQSFLWRQPQLITANLAAAGYYPTKNPLTWWTAPFYAYAAAVIATSCMYADPLDFDARRLSWLLCETVAPVNWLCRKAQKIWAKRLLKTYPNGYKDVMALGFQLDHPFIRYAPKV